jgi:arylsulfatase I/J
MTSDTSIQTAGVSRRAVLLGSTTLAATMALSLSRPASAQAATPPHIVYIVSDDQGWKDVGFHGSDIKTPNIDGLAAAGAELTQFYAQPMCSQTRAAMLTGRYPLRTGFQTAVIPSGGLYGVPMDEYLLPQAMKAAGYETALVGKWHIGHAKTEFWPRQRGFDYFYGAMVGEIDHFKHEAHGEGDWYRNNDRIEEEGYDTTLFGNEAVKRIEGHDPSKPLYLYLAFTAPHTPYQAPDEALAKYPDIADTSRRTYAAMISTMDDQIGRVLEALDKKGMRENTLIVFHSDNGGTRSAKFTGESKVTGELPPNNGPYRDGKGTLYEGGTRVVALANWPGRIKAGKVDGMIHVVDMYPTLVSLAGGTLAKTKPLDGLDVWATISEGKVSPRTEVVYNVQPWAAAARQGDWKLVWQAMIPGKLELFNIADDPAEATNLTEANPAEVKKLQSRITELAAEAAPNLFLKDAFRLVLSEPPSTPEGYFEVSD